MQEKNRMAEEVHRADRKQVRGRKHQGWTMYGQWIQISLALDVWKQNSRLDWANKKWAKADGRVVWVSEDKQSSVLSNFSIPKKALNNSLSNCFFPFSFWSAKHSSVYRGGLGCELGQAGQHSLTCWAEFAVLGVLTAWVVCWSPP